MLSHSSHRKARSLALSEWATLELAVTRHDGFGLVDDEDRSAGVSFGRFTARWRTPGW